MRDRTNDRVSLCRTIRPSASVKKVSVKLLFGVGKFVLLSFFFRPQFSIRVNGLGLVITVRNIDLQSRGRRFNSRSSYCFSIAIVVTCYHNNIQTAQTVFCIRHPNLWGGAKYYMEAKWNGLTHISPRYFLIGRGQWHWRHQMLTNFQLFCH